MPREFTVLGGTLNSALAVVSAREVDMRLGVSEVERFPDSEVSVCLLEPVRRREVFLVQSTVFLGGCVREGRFAYTRPTVYIKATLQRL